MRTHKVVTTILFGIVALLSGCVSATIQPKQEFPDPEDGKGVVYFYRERKFVGGAVGYNVKEGDTVIGPVKNGCYFFVQATPGSHTYVASTEASSSRTVEVEAGKTYYVECSVGMGVFAGHPQLKIMNEAEAKSVLPNLKYITK